MGLSLQKVVVLRKSAFKKALPVFLGNVLEAYDFCLYGYLIVIFSKIFFPPDFKHSFVLGLFLFSVAYVSRPFGSVFWGFIADKYGRKPVLLSTLTIMIVPAICMSFIPTYEKIGISAFFIVLFLRLLQGISYGGEFPTMIVTLYEIAPKNKRGIFCCFTDTLAIFGKIIALSILLVLHYSLTEEQMFSWGWRLMFAISILFVVLFGYIRLNLTETKKHEITNNPLVSAFKYHYRTMIKIVLYMMFTCCLFFNFVIYANNLIQTKTEINFTTSLVIQTSLLVFAVILIPVMGRLSDIFGRHSMVKISIISIFILAVPIYMLFLSGNILSIILGYLLLGIFMSINESTFPAIIVDTAPTDCRVCVIAIAHSTAVLLGSLTPIISEGLIYLFKTNLAPAFYVILTGFISLIALYTLTDKQKIIEKNL